MHHSFQKKSAVFWRVTSIRLLLAILGLIIAQILMIYMIFTKEKQVILVPQLIASKETKEFYNKLGITDIY